MRLEEIFGKFTWDAVVLIDDGWPWLSIRPNYDDVATEGMNKFGPGPNTRGMKDTHTRLRYVCFGNALDWLLASISARPKYEAIGLALTPKQRMYEGMPSLLESTGIDLGSINEMLCEDYGGRVIASILHCGDYWSTDPMGDPNGSSGSPGCHMLMGSFMLCHHIGPEQVANKHLLKYLIQDVIAFEKQSHLSITPGGFAVDGRVVPASGHYLSSHKVMFATVHSAEITNKKADGGRIEQAKWDSKKRGIAEAKAREEAGNVLICMEPEAAVSTNMASSFGDKLPKLLSACTKFVRSVPKLVARISLKKVLVMVLLVFEPQVVSSVNTYYNVSVVASPPPSPRTLIMAPPPPLPPSPRTLIMAPWRVTKRGARRFSTSKRSDLTESKTEWGLPPKRIPPSCLPNCK